MANPQEAGSEHLERRLSEARAEYQRALAVYKDTVEMAHILGADHPRAISALKEAGHELEDGTRAYAQALTAYTNHLILA